ncbi:MAG: hypothetical protein RIR96_1646, partial [Bacteroidota bacterium]
KTYFHQNEKQNVSEEKSQNFMIALALILVLTFCAQERNRTFTSLRMADFESAASTNFATWAFK